MSAHSMDIDGPRSESTSMDDASYPPIQPHRYDSIQMDSPGPSDRRVSLDLLPLQRHQTSFSMKPSVATRKRKHTDDSDSLDIQDISVDHHHIYDDDSLVDNARSQPSQRKRLRQRTRQDAEFSPLLYMSPADLQDQRYPVDQETTSAFHYPPNTTDPLNAIRRFFHSSTLLEHDHGPRILPSDPTGDLDGNHGERRRSDSANSFTQVALASIPSRLSTLQDLSLPRPFEGTNQSSQTHSSSSSSHGIPVHERGLDAPLSFFVTMTRSGPGQRMGGGVSVALADLESNHPVLRLDTSTSAGTTGTTSVFLDKPLCESPESMNSDEYGRVRFEFPITARGHIDAASGP